MSKYANNQIVEMLCQLRFPTILKINNDLDESLSKFQEKIKDKFPNYKLINENVVNVDMSCTESNVDSITPQVLRSNVKNHMFCNENEKLKLNLTSNFISLTTQEYDCWNGFKNIFEEVMNYFCEIYNVNNFNRIGIRYINAFSKQELNIDEQEGWNKYLDDSIVGLSARYDVKVYNTNIEIPFSDNTQMRIIAGLGTKGNDNNHEIKPVFILDKDTYELGNFDNDDVKNRLDNLHQHNSEIFESLIKENLRKKMGVVGNE